MAIDGKKLSPAALLTKLNELGRDNGIGRLDLVENRFVGMKSRGMYETPGGTILLAAHRGIESITLDRGAAHLKDELMPKYAELVYNGFWFAPEREMLQAAIDKSQEFVTRPRPAQALQGQCHRRRPREPLFALRSGPGDLRGRRGRLRPPRRRGLHQAQRPAAAHARPTAARSSSCFDFLAGSGEVTEEIDEEMSDGQPAGNWFLIAIVAGVLAGCAGDKKANDVDPNIFPAQYKQEIIDTLRARPHRSDQCARRLCHRAGLVPVGKDSRFAVCVRSNSRDYNRNYPGSKDRIAYFFGGHLNQLIDATKEQCGNAAFKPSERTLSEHM